jgi:integrase
MLTVAAVRNRKPQRKRVEVPDGQGLHLVIQPSGKKSWAVRYRRADGRPVKLTLGTVDVTGAELEGEPVIGGHLTLAAARKLNAEVQRQRALGNDPVADRKAEKLRQRAAITNAAETSFLAGARYYIEHGRRKRTAKGIARSRGWRDTAAVLGVAYPEDGSEPALIKGGLAERWRDRPVVKITGEDIFVAVDEARERGVPGRRVRNREASNSRAHEMVSALNGMFKFLHEKRRVTSNPCIGISRPSAPTARERALNAKSDVRGADELRWLWTACDAVGAPMGHLAKLLLLTGQRRTEVAEMRIEELNDDLTIWRIPGERTKNGRPHEVPLPPLARRLLTELGGKRTSGFVFVSSKGTAISAFSKGKRKLDESMLEAAREEDADATIKPWTLHDLRRTAVTGMVELDIAPHVVEAVVNHISGTKGGVAGIYNRSTLDKPKREALEAWGTYIQALTTPKVVPIKGGRKAS